MRPPTAPGDAPTLVRTPGTGQPFLWPTHHSGLSFVDCAGVALEVPGYELGREVGRGGMGRVVAARDVALGRDVAVKVLLPSADPADASRRFEREARITARLPHPGVPPVHALGRTPAGSPFLVMKLVRGRTLSALLADREHPATDLPRFLAAFEQVCQAVGFAHSQGVVHRDLKPANVMVGAFGEVQVMDWGLAKEVRSGEHRRLDAASTPPPTACPTPPPTGGPSSDFLTPHSSDHTLAGTVLGTLGYMAPEQARGDDVDARADVFALGGILLHILTGLPPVPEPGSGDHVTPMGTAALGPAFAALNACDADPDLVALVKDCLCPDPAGRPADGVAVADRLAGHRAGVEDRLRQAERDRAAAATRAAETRKWGAVLAALAASVLALGGVSGAWAWWHDRQRAERVLAEERADAARALDAERLRAERKFTRDAVARMVELAAGLREGGQFGEARATLENARELVRRGGAEDAAPAVARARADLAFVEELDAVRTRRATWVARPGGAGGFDTGSAAPAYRTVFAAHGIDVSRTLPAAAAAAVAKSGVKPYLVAALDDWAATESDPEVRAWVLDVARRADPGPWLDRFRDPAVHADPGRLAALADDADPKGTPAPALVTLAYLMRDRGLDPARLLAAAQAARPTDFEITFFLGQHEHARDPVAAAGHFRAARALRPDNFAVAINLGSILHRTDPAAAAALFREAARIDPKGPYAWHNLGNALADLGRTKEAADAYREAVRLDPGYARAQLDLGQLLRRTGDPAGAVGPLREAAAADPGSHVAATALGCALARSGDPAGAVGCFRQAVRLLPTDARYHVNLGLALIDSGSPGEAADAFAEALRIDPNSGDAKKGLETARTAPPRARTPGTGVRP